MRKIIQLSLLALLISACTLEKPKKSSVDHRMEELNDSLSYAIGLDMGMRMELEYKDINHKMLNKGIDDYFSKNKYTNINKLHDLASALLENETINAKEFIDIINNGYKKIDIEHTDNDISNEIDNHSPPPSEED